MTPIDGNIDPVLFRLAAEQTQDYALILLDREGHIRSWNLGAERLKGYTRDRIIGQHFSIFYPAEAVQTGWPAYELDVAQHEGRFEDEGWRVRADGTRFWASVVITALRDPSGQLLGFSKITRDLTERMLQQESLRESEERFRLLVDGVTDYAIFMLDAHGIVTSWNPGAERITGYTPQAILGHPVARLYPQGDVASGKAAEHLRIARESGRVESEGWQLRRDGEPFWARVVITALHDRNGALRGFADVTQDLTQRRHVEALQKAAANVNEFIATLAHELRNPLAPVRNAVQVMGQFPPTDPIREVLRETIDRQSANLARMVDDLIDITRVTRGTFAMTRRTTDLAEVVRDATEAASPAIETGQHSLEIVMPENAMLVLGDPHRLAQLFVNLLNNAARYTPPGGRITVVGAREGDSAVVRVRDNGQGIEPELIDRIFDMFVQGRSPLQRVGGGLGVGLALARRIAELHGGTIEAESAGRHHGAEFIVRLPLTEPSAAHAFAADQPESAATPPVPVKRVLVVDDNVDAAMMLELLLRTLGHDTRIANDGMRAIELAAQFRPDLVLLDIGMPGLTGYDVARQLRAMGTPMRIIAVTGWSQESDRKRSLEAGFDLHLVKPVSPEQLVTVLSEAGGDATSALH